MSCNCKKKPQIEEALAHRLIKKYAIDNEVLPISDRSVLYRYYDQLFGTNTPDRCTMCWDEYVKQKLIDSYIAKV
jgi:hypothetical protein